jgi:hypothetical protein
MQMSEKEVTISQKFRGGSIFYREGDKEVPFEWEFGGSVVALIWGTKGQDWDRCHPWAAGRQPEVYDFVAKEVIRQKAPTSNFEIDLTAGMITVL